MACVQKNNRKTNIQANVLLQNWVENMQTTLSWLFAITLTFVCTTSHANEIILDCYDVDRAVYKFEHGWFADSVFERREAEWLPFCTVETLQPQVLHKIDRIELKLTDRGAKCQYSGLRDDGSRWSQRIVLDFILGTNAWSQSIDKCVLVSD